MTIKKSAAHEILNVRVVPPWSSSDDDHGLIRAQQSGKDKSALIVSASLASDYVRLFGPGEPGEIPILAPKKTSNWNTTLDASAR